VTRRETGGVVDAPRPASSSTAFSPSAIVTVSAARWAGTWSRFR
jgi:hypothetical protein